MLVPEYALKRGKADGHLPEGVLCILGPQEEAVSTVLVVITVGPEISPYLLDLLLSLAIGLGVISREEVDGDVEEFEEGCLYLGCELGPMVKENLFRC